MCLCVGKIKRPLRASFAPVMPAGHWFTLTLLKPQPGVSTQYLNLSTSKKLHRVTQLRHQLVAKSCTELPTVCTSFHKVTESYTCVAELHTDYRRFKKN